MTARLSTAVSLSAFPEARRSNAMQHASDWYPNQGSVAERDVRWVYKQRRCIPGGATTCAAAVTVRRAPATPHRCSWRTT